MAGKITLTQFTLVVIVLFLVFITVHYVFFSRAAAREREVRARLRQMDRDTNESLAFSDRGGYDDGNAIVDPQQQQQQPRPPNASDDNNNDKSVKSHVGPHADDYDTDDDEAEYERGVEGDNNNETTTNGDEASAFPAAALIRARRAKRSLRHRAALMATTTSEPLPLQRRFTSGEAIRDAFDCNPVSLENSVLGVKRSDGTLRMNQTVSPQIEETERLETNNDNDNDDDNDNDPMTQDNTSGDKKPDSGKDDGKKPDGDKDDSKKPDGGKGDGKGDGKDDGDSDDDDKNDGKNDEPWEYVNPITQLEPLSETPKNLYDYVLQDEARAKWFNGSTGLHSNWLSSERQYVAMFSFQHTVLRYVATETNNDIRFIDAYVRAVAILRDFSRRFMANVRATAYSTSASTKFAALRPTSPQLYDAIDWRIFVTMAAAHFAQCVHFAKDSSERDPCLECVRLVAREPYATRGRSADEVDVITVYRLANAWIFATRNIDRVDSWRHNERYRELCDTVRSLLQQWLYYEPPPIDAVIHLRDHGR